MSAGPQLLPSPQPRERNWLPPAIAVAVVLIAILIAVLFERGNRNGLESVTPVSAAPDAYAANLSIDGLSMSESTNLAGGKITYLDGHIANRGDRTITGIAVQVLFRNSARQVAQNETQPLKLIRMREPYIDIEPVSAAPLKPGGEQDFRLIFDAVSPDWDGAYPELRVIHVDTK